MLRKLLKKSASCVSHHHLVPHINSNERKRIQQSFSTQTPLNPTIFPPTPKLDRQNEIHLAKGHSKFRQKHTKSLNNSSSQNTSTLETRLDGGLSRNVGIYSTTPPGGNLWQKIPRLQTAMSKVRRREQRVCEGRGKVAPPSLCHRRRLRFSEGVNIGAATPA